MAENPSLDTLPDDIYFHYLLPYLSHLDVFALRQVNHRLNTIFSSDSCWRRFVHYPLKYILCDLRSRPTAVEVAQVLEDISQQERPHCWLNFCRLQEAHLHNWVSGRDNYYDTISLPLRDMAYMEEMVDDNHEHWVCFSVCETLHVWNITAQPQALEAVTVGPHRLVRLSSCRKILVKGEEGCILTVYEILPDVNTVQYSCRFRFDEEAPRNLRDRGRDDEDTQYSLYFRFILMNHILIGYMCQLPTFQEGFLHLWNLNENRKWYIINLAEILQVFEIFLCNNGVKLKQRCHLHLFEGESSYIIVVLKYISNKTRFSQIHTFDINLKHFTHLIAQTSSEVLSCSMFRNKISVSEKIPSQDSSCVSVYSVPDVPAGNGDAGQAVLLQARCLYQFNPNNRCNVVLKMSKVFIRTSSEVIIIITEPTLYRMKITMDTGYKILGFIEPKLLLMYDSLRNPVDTEIRVYNVLSQRMIRTWDHVNADSSRFEYYFNHLVYPSKLILNIGSDRDQFRVYNF